MKGKNSSSGLLITLFSFGSMGVAFLSASLLFLGPSDRQFREAFAWVVANDLHGHTDVPVFIRDWQNANLQDFAAASKTSADKVDMRAYQQQLRSLRGGGYARQVQVAELTLLQNQDVAYLAFYGMRGSGPQPVQGEFAAVVGVSYPPRELQKRVFAVYLQIQPVGPELLRGLPRGARGPNWSYYNEILQPVFEIWPREYSPQSAFSMTARTLKALYGWVGVSWLVAQVAVALFGVLSFSAGVGIFTAFR